MTDEIRLRLLTQPFVPFKVHVADGREFNVPTPDHAHVRPGGMRVSIYTDEGREFILAARMLTGLAFDESHTEPNV